MDFAYLGTGFVCPLIARLRWWWVTDGSAAI